MTKIRGARPEDAEATGAMMADRFGGVDGADWLTLGVALFIASGGLRVRGYRATVTLDDEPEGGTLIRWRSTYDHAGPLTALMLRLAVRDACKRLAKAASETTTRESS